jgi:hypothetical protein
MSIIDTVASICTEFTDVVLVDHNKNSVIINVKKEWYRALNTRLKSLKFELVHKTTIKSGYTCTYVLEDKKKKK